MKVYYWKSADGNFGDDLNLWLWEKLMPGAWPEVGDVLLAGVGTVLSSRHLPDSEKILVFGSGTGYGKISSKIEVPWRHIYGVRGPLTAALLNLDNELALSDPAILLPDVIAKPDINDASKQIIFVPHIESARNTNWGEICERASIILVDPRADAEQVITAIASAKMVLAESMHAAIIADAYRVPWIPVWSSRKINKFKWTDWALSVGAVIKPYYLSPPSSLAKLDNMLSSLTHDNDSELVGANFSEEVHVEAVVTSYQRVLAQRNRAVHTFSKKVITKLKNRVVVPLIKYFGKKSRGASDKTVADFHRLKCIEGSLSSEDTFIAAKNRLYDKLTEFKKDRSESFRNIKGKKDFHNK
jgi:hypothetical protein